MDNQTIGIEEAARFLGFKSKENLRIKANLGIIPGFKAGRSWMFYMPDLLAYIRSQYTLRKHLADNKTRGNTTCQSPKRKTAHSTTPGSQSAVLEFKNLREQLLNRRRNDTKKNVEKK